jgi:NADPH:quinone reductase-like Zn-dependent oxidoreductase
MQQRTISGLRTSEVSSVARSSYSQLIHYAYLMSSKFKRRGDEMKAVQIFPGSEGGTLQIVDVPTPVPADGEVLVRVRASGLNRGEINMVRRARSGAPIPAGVEFAGEVAALGAGVQDWQPGDRVVGHGTGGQAEYVIANPLALMRIPNALPWTNAAAFPNVFITAHDALVTNGQLKPGETVLVNAASSGIGLAAIQIASALGAGMVIATSRSAAKVQKLKQLGVEHAIDISKQDQVEAVKALTGDRGVDVIIDSVGGTVFEANLNSLAVQGRLINIGRLGSSTATMNLELLWLKRLKLIGVTFRTRTEAERLACVQACARDLLPHLQEDRLQLPIDRTYRLDEVAKAHAYMDTDQHFGKIVLTTDDAFA